MGNNRRRRKSPNATEWEFAATSGMSSASITANVISAKRRRRVAHDLEQAGVAAADDVVLWEAHSIRSRVPMFFDGRLPDLNLGTADGATTTPALQARLAEVLAGQDRCSHVSNGRFKGGYITRHYAEPARAIEAVQLEMAQACYMDEDAIAWRDDRAAAVQPVLRALLGPKYSGDALRALLEAALA